MSTWIRFTCISLLCGCSAALAQSLPTAKRRLDVQVGLGVSAADSDYDRDWFGGGTFYFTIDPHSHFGLEGDIHQMNTRDNDNVYQRTYEIGPRYYREYGKFAPYVKLMYGRGVFNFSYNVANLAYNIYTGGGGVDYRLLRFLNLRADYEYQMWTSFPPNGLSPQVVTIGVAYHFPGGLARGLHYK